MTKVLYYMTNQTKFSKQNKVQCRACLTITGTIQGASREKNYDKLGLHSLVKDTGEIR